MITVLVGFFVFYLLINLLIVDVVNNGTNSVESKRYPFYQKWETVLSVSPINKVDYYFLKIFFFMPTIIAFFSRRKEFNNTLRK